MRRFITATLAVLTVGGVLAVGASEAKADHFRHHGGYGYGYRHGFGRGGYHPPYRHYPPFRGVGIYRPGYGIPVPVPVPTPMPTPVPVPAPVGVLPGLGISLSLPL
jgi:hypothetical protein